MVAVELRSQLSTKEEWLERREVHHPTVYLINTIPYLHELGQRLHSKSPLTVDQIPDDELDRLASYGSHLYFMGIYERGIENRRLALTHHSEYRRNFYPEIKEEDNIGSAFAIAEYVPHMLVARDWSGWDTFRERLNSRGAKVIIDVVPNHWGIDNQWLSKRPNWLVQLTAQQAQNNPGLYHERVIGGITHYIARGRDPYFPSWEDTAQINPWGVEIVDGKPKLALDEIIEIVLRLGDHTDGFRFDMASLLLSNVFTHFTDSERQGWGEFLSHRQRELAFERPYFPEVITALRKKFPDIFLIAEAYEYQQELYSLGFNAVYDMDFYRVLEGVENGSVNLYNLADALKYRQAKLPEYVPLIFIENHDEPPSLEHFPNNVKPFATILAGSGLPVLEHYGQWKGFTKKIPVHLAEYPEKLLSDTLGDYYYRLQQLRSSELFQRGEHWIGDPAGDPHKCIFVQGVRYQEREAILCTNFAEQEAWDKFWIKGQDLHVYDLNRGAYLPDQEIDNDLTDGFTIRLAPKSSQVIYYTSV